MIVGCREEVFDKSSERFAFFAGLSGVFAGVEKVQACSGLKQVIGFLVVVISNAITIKDAGTDHGWCSGCVKKSNRHLPPITPSQTAIFNWHVPCACSYIHNGGVHVSHYPTNQYSQCIAIKIY